MRLRNTFLRAVMVGAALCLVEARTGLATNCGAINGLEPGLVKSVFQSCENISLQLLHTCTMPCGNGSAEISYSWKVGGADWPPAAPAPATLAPGLYTASVTATLTCPDGCTYESTLTDIPFIVYEVLTFTLVANAGLNWDCLNGPGIGDFVPTANPASAAGSASATLSLTSAYAVGNTCPNNCTYVVQVTDPCNSIVSNTEEFTIPSTTSCPLQSGGCGQAGEPGPFDIASLHVGYGVGHSASGVDAGRIRLNSDDMVPELATRAALAYATRDLAIDVIQDTGGLRQVLTADAFVDLVTINQYKYEIRFYRRNQAGTKQDGVYVPVSGAEPFKTVRIENPDASPSVFNRLKITEASGSTSTVSMFSYSDEDGWGLSTGNGLRSKSKQEGTIEGGGRFETVTVRNASDTVVRQTETVYEDPGCGERVTQIIEDPSGAELTTHKQYYTNAGDKGAYGRLASVQNPDGSWEKYAYSSGGRVTKTLASWKDVTLANATDGNCRLTENSYTPVGTGDDGSYRPTAPRTVSEYVEGNVVRRTWHGYVVNSSEHTVTETTEQAASPSAVYGDNGNLRTVTVRYTYDAAAYLAGKTKSVERPDGLLDTYVYDAGTFTLDTNSPGNSSFTTGSGSDLRVTCVHGTATSPEGIANKTTSDVTMTDTAGATVMTEQSVWNGTTYERIRWSVTENDALGHPLTTWNSDGTEASQTWGSCCGKLSETLADGTEYSYGYDDLKHMTERVKEGVGTQVDITTSYTYDAEGRRLSETVSDPNVTVSLATSTAYDVAGRVVGTTDAAQLVTSYSYSDGGRVTTVTRPGGGTEITENYLDGRVKSVTGTGVVAKYFEYEATSGGLQWTLVRTGADNSPMWERTTTDFLGRTFRTEKPTFDGNTLATESAYNSAGQVVKTRTYVVENSTNVVAPTLYEYDQLGNATRSGLDVNGNDVLNLSSSDRINDTGTVYEHDTNDDWWRTTTQKTYATANSSTATVTGVHKERITGLGGTSLVVQETSDTDIHGQQTVTTVTVNSGTKNVTRTVNVPDSDTDEQTVTVNGLAQSMRAKENLTTQYTYDALGRRIGVTDPRTGTSTTHYNGNGQVDWVENAASNRTTFTYDANTGLRIAVTDPLSTTVYTAYTAHGQVWRTWGGGTYPLEYVYDSYGRLYQLKTFRGGTGWPQATWPTNTGTADVTTWTYHAATGQLIAKTYADNKGTGYTYDSAGRLATRTWARQANSQDLVTTYGYDATTGELIGIDYSDSTPDVTFTYTRTGRKATVTDAAGTRTFAYTAELGEDRESIAGGLYTKLITRKYDGLGRSGGFQIGTTNDLDADYDVSYSYDSKGRFGGVETTVPSTFSATYGYVTNSNLIGTVTFPSSVTTTKSYEATRDLLSAVTNRVGQTTISQYAYTNDAAGRRTQSGWSGSAFSQGDTITYGYNARSEVTSADAQNRSQYEFDYTYDNIGNREEYAIDGGTATTYTSNELNQYEVTVEPTEAFIYDDDGSLIADGDFEYAWDAENRLASVVADEIVKVEFVYDYMSRRIAKRVYTWANNSWSLDTELRFVYDGWNPVLELCTTGELPASTARTWGIDLSGTLQGAGGVGGLLAAHLSGQVNAFMFDGNGNVSEALRVSNGSIEAHYEYDPFGGTTASSGSWASANPFRFSTKYLDGESGLYYYGLRSYSPRLGRWISRDPLGETGGANIAAFTGNCPVGVADFLGLAYWGKETCAALMADMAKKAANLALNIGKYDPVEDGKGGWPMPWGTGKTKPGGHYEKIMDLKRGLYKDYRTYYEKCFCKDCPDDPPPQEYYDLLNQHVPVPVYPPGYLVGIPGSDEFWDKIGIGAGVIGGGAVVGIGLITAPEIVIPGLIKFATCPVK